MLFDAYKYQQNNVALRRTVILSHVAQISVKN